LSEISKIYEDYKYLLLELKTAEQYTINSIHINDLKRRIAAHKIEIINNMTNGTFDVFHGMSEERKKFLLMVYHSNNWKRYNLSTIDEEDLSWIWHHDATLLSKDEDNWEKLNEEERTRYRYTYYKIHNLKPEPRFLR